MFYFNDDLGCGNINCCRKGCTCYNGYRCNKANYGEKGERGPQGLQGVQGEKGERGIQGLQGLKGEQGSQGVQGERGEQGLQGLQGERGEQGIQGLQGERGIQGEQGATGVVQPFEYAQFISIEPQTIEPNSLTSHVLFEERIYASSGITMNNGIVTFSIPGIYRVTYDIYTASGASNETIFAFGYPESTSSYLTGSDARVVVEAGETTATFLVNIDTSSSYRINIFGTAVTLASGYRTTARLTITQVNHATTDGFAINEQITTI